MTCYASERNVVSHLRLVGIQHGAIPVILVHIMLLNLIRGAAASFHMHGQHTDPITLIHSVIFAQSATGSTILPEATGKHLAVLAHPCHPAGIMYGM